MIIDRYKRNMKEKEEDQSHVANVQMFNKSGVDSNKI